MKNLLPDVVDNHSNSNSMITLENMLEKRGFATPLSLISARQHILDARNKDAGHRYTPKIPR